MNVHFVCRANLGRSQMAQAMFNRLSRHRSSSTGTMVLEMEGQTLAERAKVAPSVVLVLELMSEEEGLDLSSEQRTQLTPELFDAADKVIVMAERETWPDYLVEGGKVEFWEIADAFNISKDQVQAIKEQIKVKVEALVRETG
jgi:protein-tyrosine-phosphatase